MARLKISEVNLTHFKTIEIDGVLLYSAFPKIKSYISANISRELADLLAEPILRKSEEGYIVSWFSDQFNQQPISYSQLSDENKQTCQLKLKKLKDKLINYISKLNSKNQSNNWVNILTALVLEEQYLFEESGQFAIVNWSLKSINSSKGSGFFDSDSEKNIKQNSEAKNEKTKIEETNLEIENESKTNSEAVLNNKPIHETDGDDFDETVKDIKGNDSINNQGNFTNQSEETGVDDINEREEIKDDFSDEDENNHGLNKHSNNNYGKRVKVSENNSKIIITPKKKKKYWLWILLAIFILLCLSLLKYCSVDIPKNELPEKDKPLEKVDPVDVILDEDDEIKYVISGRLNIALIKPEETKLNQLAVDIKKSFPNVPFNFVYSDSLTRRIQVKVPPEHIEFLKKNIPIRLANYKLLIWKESVYRKSKTFTDPGFKSKEKSWFINTIQASAAWNTTIGNENITIAIIDNSFDISHPELSNKIVKPYNVWTKTNQVNNGSKFIHGTHVAGSAIAIADNNSGVSGICPGCKFMPITAGDSNGIMSNTSVIDAVLYAINQGADVVNLSLGIQFGSEVGFMPKEIQLSMIENSFKEEEQFWDRVFKIAEANNTTLIMSAGNENILAGMDPMKRNPLGIKVSALNTNNQKATFSNYGKYSTISAPGVKIYSSIPNYGYQYLQGTSMASPLVAGGVGLIKSLKPKISTAKIISLIQKTGKPVGSEGRKVGNLLQLDNALKELLGKNNSKKKPNVRKYCEDVNEEIKRLKKRLKELEQLCVINSDTLKIPPLLKNNKFLEGKWKSTTSLYNESEEKVQLYFEFKGKDGLITFLEPSGISCEANLNVSLSSSNIIFDQSKDALCKSNGKSYNSYSFSCNAGKNGLAECTAQNKSVKANTFKFTLIKIK